MMKLFNRTKSAPEEMTLEERLYYYRHRGHVVPSKHILKTPEQIEGIRRSAAVNTAVLDMVAAHIREGISTGEIDRLVYDYTVSHGAIPAPLNYEGFPKSVCTSINEEVCHGIPDDDIVLQEGDIVNVDVSTILNGYYSDASRMFMIGSVRPACKRLVAAAQPWGFLGDIGEAIQSHAEANGFSVVRDFCGHGVGLKFHEKPEVEHVGRKGSGMLLVPGMIFTIEPMINMGSYKVYVDSDNEWTVLTEDGKPSAQWENTILITPNGVEILTY